MALLYEKGQAHACANTRLHRSWQQGFDKKTQQPAQAIRTRGTSLAALRICVYGKTKEIETCFIC
jgi:hypothetical protein